MFIKIKVKVEQQLDKLVEGNLYQVGLGRNELFDAYLQALPLEERQPHNCNCCKSFLRQYGNIVSIIDGEVHTLWDFELEGIYSKVPSALKNLILAKT